MPRADDFAVANQQGRHVAAVDIFQLSVALDASDDHSRVFFANVFVGEEAIGSGHDFGQGHASGELGINHSLERVGEQGSGHSLSAHVGEHNRKAVFRNDGIEEVAANFFTGKISALDVRERNIRPANACAANSTRKSLQPSIV